MIRSALVGLLLLGFGALRVPIESSLTAQHRRAYFHTAQLNLGLRDVARPDSGWTCANRSGSSVSWRRSAGFAPSSQT